MTRRDQTLRAWIRRPSPGAHWLSCVSFHAKHYELTTHTHLRQAALEFNVLHLRTILTPIPSTPADSDQTLFPFSHD